MLNTKILRDHVLQDPLVEKLVVQNIIRNIDIYLLRNRRYNSVHVSIEPTFKRLLCWESDAIFFQFDRECYGNLNMW